MANNIRSQIRRYIVCETNRIKNIQEKLIKLEVEYRPHHTDIADGFKAVIFNLDECSNLLSKIRDKV